MERRNSDQVSVDGLLALAKATMRQARAMVQYAAALKEQHDAQAEEATANEHDDRVPVR